MNWKLIAHATWHGIGAGLIAGATAVGTYQTKPEGWQIVILLGGIAVAIWKGAEGYLKVPSDM